jgi:hypothetical protein
VAEIEGAQINLLVPDSDDIAAVGPLSSMTFPTHKTFADDVVSIVASADVLLTLTTLDPALPSDHLRTWATEAVVVVTAGSSSWTKIHAVGELIRLAGTRVISAVLIGADKWDESLGVTAARGSASEGNSNIDRGTPEGTRFYESASSRLKID